MFTSVLFEQLISYSSRNQNSATHSRVRDSSSSETCSGCKNKIALEIDPLLFYS